jgi:predicted nuclease of predicted toxin-antitoxin system
VRLLFDQNISARIVRHLQDSFPNCTQVTLEGLNNAKDFQIWDWAAQNKCCIVTFDSDFLDILTLKGFPPKILLLRLGNRRTKQLAGVLIEKKATIDTFLTDSSIGCLQVYS